ncbi:MAG: peptidoglycan editing factor PgeF [Candidatus Parabeggiatoa sp. nov. 3]|nr:MAG: peptidoglycan editing factor PgeF [Gammaproteobacteria bacterium]RKZ68864.1 MAG: peptidoglycan editing factor PgeF [Gammaproteobacteria bacterium]RKZ89267.1 MAG: peptidoglycan editing factor PgeF [Gammaproteobacteria bacterium]
MVIPNWPAPSVVKAYTTTREGGYSQPPFEGFNLADHVGDDPDAVAANRAALVETLELPSEPVWLKQVHGIQTVSANAQHRDCMADAVYATELEQVCVVMTADCLPVLFCDRAGTRVAAAHAGWRGLASGVLETTLQTLDLPAQDILVWLGPAIGPDAFEVGDEVREAFIDFLPEAAEAFKSNREGHWLADLYLLARQRLAHEGVTAVYGGDFCTYSDAKRFYSYRRDKVTGRMASLIWLAR